MTPGSKIPIPWMICSPNLQTRVSMKDASHHLANCNSKRYPLPDCLLISFPVQSGLMYPEGQPRLPKPHSLSRPNPLPGTMMSWTIYSPSLSVLKHRIFHQSLHQGSLRQFMSCAMSPSRSMPLQHRQLFSCPLSPQRQSRKLCRLFQRTSTPWISCSPRTRVKVVLISSHHGMKYVSREYLPAALLSWRRAKMMNSATLYLPQNRKNSKALQKQSSLRETKLHLRRKPRRKALAIVRIATHSLAQSRGGDPCFNLKCSIPPVVALTTPNRSLSNDRPYSHHHS